MADGFAMQMTDMATEIVDVAKEIVAFPDPLFNATIDQLIQVAKDVVNTLSELSTMPT